MPESAEGGTELQVLSDWLYPELRRLANRAMRGEQPGHTLQTTALIHEAYLRLAESGLRFESRGHFLALSATTMRRVLVDHARGRDRQKRGGRQQQVTLGEHMLSDAGPDLDLLALDQALIQLQQVDPRRARLVEYQLFAGMSYPEMAVICGVSEATVHRELRLGRAWVQRALAEERSANGDAEPEP
jgi:RNA polymerase sigma factor (TIGR02999 family)